TDCRQWTRPSDPHHTARVRIGNPCAGLTPPPSSSFDSLYLHVNIFQGVDLKNVKTGVYWTGRVSPHDHCGALIMKHVFATVTSPLSNPASPPTIEEMTSIVRSPTRGGVTMPVSPSLNAYLDRERVHYDVLPH